MDGKPKDILQNYKSEYIYNADETALFFKCTPDKTYCIKGQPCVGGKWPQDRISVLVTSNMIGNDKMPLLVIGKSKKPCRFKNVHHLPVDYYANTNTWMTSDIFMEWIRKLDRKMKVQGRKIALLVDNCSAHPCVDNLQHVQLIFLLHNTMSLIQPMDQGIIQILKMHYRKLLAHKKLAAFDQQEEFKEDLLVGLYNLRKTWVLVKLETVQNCFMHTFFPENEEFHGFSPSDIPYSPEEDGLYEGIRILMDEFVRMAIETDDKEQCRAALADDDIIAAVKMDYVSEDNIIDTDANDESETLSLPCVSCREAFSMSDGLTRFFAQSNSLVILEEAHGRLEKLQCLLQREQLLRLKQKKLA